MRKKRQPDAPTTGEVRSSLAQVAARSGVSPATVSRVLAGSPHPVAEETRARVMEAASELSYSPNAIARALARKMTNTVGVIVGDITDTDFAQIARGVEDSARARGYLTVVCNTDRSGAAEAAYLRMLLEHQAAGIVISGGWYPSCKEAPLIAELARSAIATTQTRIVFLSDRDNPDIPLIVFDERAVVADLTRYLLSLGHRSIAFIDGPPGLTISSLRRDGFVEAMREAGLTEEKVFEGGFGVEAGRAAAAQILRQQQLPDAIIASTDDSGLGLLTTLRQAGIDVPRQVSVASVDDSPHAQLMDLTTVRLPQYELGSMAAQLVLFAETPLGPGRTVLPHRIVVRGSTAWSPRMIETGARGIGA
jgi:LacI family transcriptional regulator